MKIDISEYDYGLDDAQIAKYPVSPRDQSKLLVYKNGEIQHKHFYEIAGFLPANTHLVLNNTKVIPARLHFRRKTGAVIEIFLLNPILPSTVLPLVMENTSATVWHCVVGNKKKWKDGEVLVGEFPGGSIEASWQEINENNVQLKWSGGQPLAQVLELYGNVPLPPYLNRESESADTENYQTIYSENEGAVAAPTAGLHFTDKVFDELEKKGVQKSFVTLHVGAGTFMPVKEANAINHPMHSEQIVVEKSFLEALIKNSEFIVPVGTTSMRTLESLYWFGVKILEGGNTFFIEKLFPYQDHESFTMKQAFQGIIDFMGEEEQLVGSTEIMIFPGYQFRVCKALITNFHQPASTLLLLVAALVGEEKWKEIYDEAKKTDYRFLSFGDSSLLTP